MAIDLLPVGEELAELDLVVRQLDDGTLTAASDDKLPDAARLRIGPEGEGIKAWQLVVNIPAGQGSRVAAGLGTINAGLARGALFVRGAEVRFEAALDHAPPYGREELKDLYDCVTQGSAGQRAAVERLLAGPAAAAAAAATVPAGGLPSSYLPGAGQKGGDTATQRFGPLGQVPGRGELAPGEKPSRPPSFPAASGGGGGGGGGALIAAGVVGLLAVGGAGAFFALRRADEGAVATATEAPGGPTEGGAPKARTERPDGPKPPTGESPGGTSTTTDDGGGARGTEQPGGGGRETEADLVARAREPGRRVEAVERWLKLGFDRELGARRRMLEALGPRLDEDEPRAARLLSQSLRDRPPSTAEAIECLSVAAGGVRRVLIGQLAETTGPEAQEVVKALAAEEDDEDLHVEEALLKLGHVREGAPLRLAKARGAEWVTYGDGRALFEALARRDVRLLRSLFEHPSPEVRVVACSLISAAEQPREALALLAPVLRDPEPSVRQRAAEGLTALKDPRASWPLARGLIREDETAQTRDVLRGGLQRLPLKETVELLTQLYGRPDVSDRRAAVVGLSAVGKPESIPGVVAALRDADRTVKLEALRALDAAFRQPALKSKVTEGLASIRELGLNRADRELYQIARQLHHHITGRMPEDSVRDQRR